MTDKAVIESYVAKLDQMLQCEIMVTNVMLPEIKSHNEDNPKNSLIWWDGAKNGLLVFFFRILSPEEQKLNTQVLAHAKKALGGGDNPISLDNYVDSAVAVLAQHGFEVIFFDGKNNSDRPQ